MKCDSQGRLVAGAGSDVTSRQSFVMPGMPALELPPWLPKTAADCDSEGNSLPSSAESSKELKRRNSSGSSSPGSSFDLSRKNKKKCAKKGSVDLLGAFVCLIVWGLFIHSVSVDRRTNTRVLMNCC